MTNLVCYLAWHYVDASRIINYHVIVWERLGH
jgi:hypothetical protein